MSIYSNEDLQKEEIIHNFLEELKLNSKYAFQFNQKKHIVYFNNKLENEFYICKLAKESNQVIQQEGETDIEEKNIDTFPCVKVILDLHKQKILVEKKTSVFKDSVQIQRTLQEWFNNIVLNKGYEFIVEGISDEKAFWEEIKNSNYIYSLHLKLNSPNLFGGKAKATEFVQEVKDQFNNTSMEIKLENKKGALQLLKEQLDSFIKYATAGGGSWEIRTSSEKRKKPKKLSSKQKIKEIDIKENIEELPIEDSSKELQQAFDSVETILKEDDDNDKDKKNERKI
jgi:hypothetical protein